MLTLGPGYSWVPYKNSANFFSRLYQDININIYKYYHRALLYNKIEVPTFYKIQQYFTISLSILCSNPPPPVHLDYSCRILLFLFTFLLFFGILSLCKVLRLILNLFQRMLREFEDKENILAEMDEQVILFCFYKTSFS